MKKFVLFVSLSVLVIALHSCCKLCTIDYSKITFHGYTELEMDSVSIITYEANSDIMVDSIHALVTPEGDHFSYRMATPLSPDYDYQINIFRTKQEFEISDLTIETRKCNCDEAEYLKSYMIDGGNKEGNIEIHK